MLRFIRDIFHVSGFMFKIYSSRSLVITSRWFATSRLASPASVRLVYCDSIWTDWLTDWLTDWWTDGLTDWLTDWLADWLHWLHWQNSSVHSSENHCDFKWNMTKDLKSRNATDDRKWTLFLVDWLTDWVAMDGLNCDSLWTDWLTVWLTHWLTDWRTGLTNRLGWLTGLMLTGLTDWLGWLGWLTD